MDRDNSGKFVKGNGAAKGSKGGSGRPPKAREERYRELLTESISFAQFKRIIKAVASKAEEGDLQAAKLLFEYIIGKPAQPLQHSGDITHSFDLESWKAKADQRLAEINQMDDTECASTNT